MPLFSPSRYVLGTFELARGDWKRCDLLGKSIKKGEYR